MTRGKWRWENGKFVDINKPSVENGTNKSVFNLIDDTMTPLWHPADGKVYDSKSAFRKATRENGCVEIGNDYNDAKPGNVVNIAKGRKEAIRDAIEQLSSPERRKEIMDQIRREQEQYKRENC